MEKKVSIKESSKTNWVTDPANEHGYPGDTNIQLGCLMRIADATEKMAGNYIRMENELKWSKERIDKNSKYIAQLERSIASYKGTITKLKKKLKNQ